MYEKRKLFLLVATLIVLFIGISTVTATTVTNDSTQNTGSDNIISDTGNSLTDKNVDSSISNAVKTQLTTTKKIDLDSVVNNKTSKKENNLKTANTITVTNGNFRRYFDNEGTTSNINAYDNIILSGNFTDKVFIIDKFGVTLTGDNAIINGGYIYIIEDASNSTISNITLNTSRYETAFKNEGENVTIINNYIHIINDDNMSYIEGSTNQVTEGINNLGDNVIIANNTVIVEGHDIDIDWTGGDRKGLASTLGIMNFGGTNVLIENNTVVATKSKNCTGNSYGTIDGIEVKQGTNVIVNNNKVNVSGSRFLYAVNALDALKNITISNNILNATGERYTDGIQVGNNADQLYISGNNITCYCYNTTEYDQDNEAMAFGIITSTMGGFGPTTKINVTNNNIKLNSTITYGIEIYSTSVSNVTNNNIINDGAYSMGISLAHSNNITVKDNNIETKGNSSQYINEIVEEIRPANIGIQIQQKSDNSTITKNTVITTDSGDNAKAINIEGTKNLIVTDNILLANNIGGNDAVIIDLNSSNIIISDNTKPAVKRNAVISIIIPENISTGSTIQIKAKVTDNDSAEVLNGKLVFKLNGVTLKDETNKPIKLNVINGTTTLEYTLKGYAARNYTITAVFANSSYNRCEAKKVLEIQKTNINFTLKNITANSGETIEFNEIVTDENGNILYGTNKVAIKINGKTIAHTTIVDGVLKTNITLPSQLRSGENNLTIIIGENNRYTSSISTSTLNILKQNAIITIDEIVSLPGSYTTFKAMLVTSITKTPITSGNYVFKLNGKTLYNMDEYGENLVKIQSITNGIATLSTWLNNDLKEGTYNITLTYSGSNQANSATNTTNALIIKL
ncbi:hypothetical protein [Methanosphaera sp. WGK6]|uniref:hypothetical protein n=1 Tax=Methanosphaera sp. WGK6 TaxID=1561964 RepID=UPI00084C1A13|nr:hypothetical protein [Methanosphaera sp. WGK6]OED30485.1 hypothetical protein NL43_02370 [Methanosphaera sp. WGK6]